MTICKVASISAELVADAADGEDARESVPEDGWPQREKREKK